MKRCSMVIVFSVAMLFTAFLFAQERNNVPPPATAFATAPEIPYDSAGANYLKFPAGLYLGEAMGVARNSKGQILVYTRSGEATRLFQFDSEGNFLREIGQGLYGFAMAHAVRVDSHDNIWAVDEGTDMVIKFNPEGRVVMLLGRRPEYGEGLLATPPNNAVPPPAVAYKFWRPNPIALDAAGGIFVSD